MTNTFNDLQKMADKSWQKLMDVDIVETMDQQTGEQTQVFDLLALNCTQNATNLCDLIILLVARENESMFIE